MLRCFIGYDPAETVAYHVLAHSILRHASVPVSVTPLKLSQLPLTRARTPTQSTEFAFSRFLVPWLCNYEGEAIFLDCDMLCRDDIAKMRPDRAAAVSVVKHDYEPKEGRKFLNNLQTAYPKKNWSSVMLFQNALCKELTPQTVNIQSGLYLHQFKWLPNEASIGSIPSGWNHLVGEYATNPDAKIAHLTLGTPCFAQYADCEFAQEWRDEQDRMLDFNKTGGFSTYLDIAESVTMMTRGMALTSS